MFRRIGLYLLSIFVLAIGFGIQYAIEFIRNKYVSVYDLDVQYGFSLVSALTVTIFNFLLGILLEFFAYH